MLNSDRISAMTRAALTQTPLAKVEVVKTTQKLFCNMHGCCCNRKGEKFLNII